MLKKILRRLRSASHFQGKMSLSTADAQQPTFTVISAVYNVGRFLDDYFTSLTAQANFVNDIELILVDDGSTDNSAEIIQEWQSRFPNIRYIYKDNGGQASARNLGIPEARGQWVTFIDPDDYVSEDYFEEVSKAVQESTFATLISTRLVFYHEDTGEIKTNHPLDFRFRASPVNFLSVSDMGKHFQMSAAHAFFKLSTITLFDLRFDEKVKPNFEDAKFTCEYLLRSRGELCAFLAKPNYIYRKRADGSSTLDQAGNDPRLFSDVIEFGMIELLEQAVREQGFAPNWLQRACLYSIVWTIRGLYRKRYVLDDELEARCAALLTALFRYIDEDIIRNFGLAYIADFDKIALLARYKETGPRNVKAEVERIEPNSNVAVMLVWHGLSESGFTLFSDKTELVPIETKTTMISLLGEPYVYATRFWFELPETGFLNGVFPGSSCVIKARAQHWEESAPSSEVLKTMRKVKNDDRKFPEEERLHRVRANLPEFRKYRGSWVFMDRENLADDNAEHLCRYIRKHYPEIRNYFILSEESPHWDRLEREGFDLLACGSEEHAMALTHCDFFLSSHIDQFVIDHPPRQYHADLLLNRKFVFLQHGVTKDDMSNWFNDKVHTDTFVTTTPGEYASVANDFSPYIFSKRQVKMVGMPRYDELLRKRSERVDRILLAPTWRPYLADVAKLRDGDNASISDFKKSDFYLNWNDVLSSQRLAQLVADSSSRLTLMLHPALEPFIDTFVLPEWIQNVRYNEVDVQEILSETRLMLTDYSSIAFDAAFLKRSLAYFQFDREDFYRKGNWRPGYFDYDRDGLGPVVRDSEACLDEIEAALGRNCVPEKQYLDRIEKTFPLRDGKNCQRLMAHLLSSPKAALGTATS